MRYGVVGSRLFGDYELVCRVLDQHYISQIISGGAKGADSLGERYAIERCIPFLVYLPEWDKYGKKAGFIRNKLIVQSSDVIIAFWDGVSVGTGHTITHARKLNKKTIIINF